MVVVKEVQIRITSGVCAVDQRENRNHVYASAVQCVGERIVVSAQAFGILFAKPFRIDGGSVWDVGDLEVHVSLSAQGVQELIVSDSISDPVPIGLTAPAWINTRHQRNPFDGRTVCQTKGCVGRNRHAAIELNHPSWDARWE